MEVLEYRKITDDKYFIRIRYDISKGVRCTYSDFSQDSPPVIEAVVRHYTMYKYDDFSQEAVRRNWIDYMILCVDLLYKYNYCRSKVFKEFVIKDIETIRKIENGDTETVLHFVKKAIAE